MPNVFRTSRRIEFADTDMAGIVHFSNFFRFMEAAEVEFLRSQNLSILLSWEEGQKIGFPRVSASCDYLRPVYFQDVVDIAVGIHRIGRKSVTYGFDFSRGEVVLARGQITTVCCRVREHQPMESMEIPALFRQRLEQIMEAHKGNV